MNRFVSVALVATAGALAGCKASIGSTSASQTEGNGALFVVSITPADQATRVPIHSKIAITFSEELDEGTVTSANVALSPVPAAPAMAYDASRRTITLTPGSGMSNDTQPYAGLHNDTTYTVTLSGIKDLAGNGMEAATYTFTTYRDLMTRLVSYADGDVDSYRTYAYDASGRETTETDYDGPGPDEAWFSGGDDAVGSSQAFTYGDDQLRIVTSYGAPGPSAPVAFYSLSRYDAGGNWTRCVYFNGIGADGGWFTSSTDWFSTDDRVWLYYQRAYDAQGRVTQSSYFNSPGRDGLWLTGDDAPASYTVYSYDAAGDQTLATDYDATDQSTGHTVNTFDGQHHLTRSEIRAPDDSLVSYATLSYDAAGNWAEMDVYQGDGSLYSTEVHDLDADGNLTTVTWTNAAGDMKIVETFDATL